MTDETKAELKAEKLKGIVELKEIVDGLDYEIEDLINEKGISETHGNCLSLIHAALAKTHEILDGITLVNTMLLFMLLLPATAHATKPDYNKWIDPTARAQAVTEALANNDGTLLLDEGLVDEGSAHAFKFPPQAKPLLIQGAGADNTTIKCGYGNSTFDGKHEGLTIGLTDNLTLQDLTLDGRCDIGTQGVAVGFDGNGKADHAIFNRVNILGTCWTLYGWNNDGDTLDLTECTLTGGRQVVSMVGSGSATGMNVNLTRCTLNLDWSLCTYQGACSSPAYNGGALAIAQRCGKLTTKDCVINIKGAPGIRIAGGTDWYSDTRSDSQVSHTNLKVNIIPNGATEVYDLDYRATRGVTVIGGTGSGMALMTPASPGAIFLIKTAADIGHALVVNCQSDVFTNPETKVTNPPTKPQLVWIGGN